MRLISALFFSCVSACSAWQSPESPPPNSETTRQYLAQWSPLRSAEIEVWPSSTGIPEDLPRRILLHLPSQSIAQYGFKDSESFRLFFREQLTEWLVSQNHPEALCTSVNLLEKTDFLELEIEIVCR